jgi:predicted dehydrogenase
MAKFKAAIIGGGHIASQNHIPALKALNEEVEIVAICSRDINKARVLADQHGIPLAFDDAAEMYKSDLEPDLIFNCTANHLHHQFTMQALENGCHVLCEKPPGLNAQQALEMAELAHSKGKVLAYNFQRRQSHEFSILKKLQEEGRFGHIYHIKATYLRRRGIPGWGNFTNKEIQGGGALIDLGVHILDLALDLLDYQTPNQILGNTYDLIGNTGGKGLKGNWDPSKFEVEDACFAHLSFSDNTSISLSCSFALNQKEEESVNLEVFGSNAGAMLNPPVMFTEIAGELTDTHFPFVEKSNWQLKNTHAFIDACLGKPSNICNATQGAVLQEIVERIYQSAESAHTVML